MTVIANYSPKFILFFTILNSSTFTSILFYPYIRYFNVNAYNGEFTLSVRKNRFLNGRTFTNIGPYKINTTTALPYLFSSTNE